MTIWHLLSVPFAESAINVRDAMIAIGWTAAAWQQAGHQLDPYRGALAGGHWSINPYVHLRPPVVVAASAQPPAGPREAAHAPPPGPVPPNTLASALLARWLASLTANKAPCSSSDSTPGRPWRRPSWPPRAARTRSTSPACLCTSCPPTTSQLELYASQRMRKTSASSMCRCRACANLWRTELDMSRALYTRDKASERKGNRERFRPPREQKVAFESTRTCPYAALSAASTWTAGASGDNFGSAAVARVMRVCRASKHCPMKKKLKTAVSTESQATIQTVC